MVPLRCRTEDDMIEAIGLDADDTLWENETFFRVTEAEFASLLRRAEHGESTIITDRGRRAWLRVYRTFKRDCGRCERQQI